MASVNHKYVCSPERNSARAGSNNSSGQRPAGREQHRCAAAHEAFESMLEEESETVQRGLD